MQSGPRIKKIHMRNINQERRPRVETSNAECRWKPCPKGPVPAHLAEQRDPPKDKPCPEDQVLTHFEVDE
ncbi:hypothetical protein TNIN_358851 [Trichonephila inaurata madagascariensis]|uniref:Uncharacterized protein n=1 Tax=Trichonephila inaurata madagascariensis TaxID=2747483 RepID=A0A8X6XWR1_9ARAC|nr:hypothetical protein TNIN_358851 [Trichonephila inaurata madagascariensis]